jgi:4-amino-4-deoxy-L-arabinose transferase-like glycosyltransferase
LRSRTFWIVAGLTALGAALRFATLGLQSYHHDEVVTASRILDGDFWHAMDAVGYSESAPPLYYAIAWLWTQVTGVGEWGLRSVSALAGVAIVPVAYLLGAELRSRRAGIVAAALVATNPMLLWYSQEARGYALFALLTSVALLYFVRALDGGRRRDFIGWGIASALALATHYFAFFPIAAEGIWLLRRHGRASIPGLRIAVIAGLLLAPLAIHQMSSGHAEWIGHFSLPQRIVRTWVTFAAGETGDVIAEPVRPWLGLAPLVLMLAALGLLVARGDGRDRRAGGVVLAIAAATLAMPLALALVSPPNDYVLARNLMPALLPLLAAVAIGVTLREARRLGAVVGAALVAYSLGFCVWASTSPDLQRPDWDGVAAKLGEPVAPRAIVTWTIAGAPLRDYLGTGAFQASTSDGFDWLVHEVDFVSNGPAASPAPWRLGPGFRLAGTAKVGRLYIQRYVLPGPGLAPIRLRAVQGASLGFHSNGTLLDGIGPQ